MDPLELQKHVPSIKKLNENISNFEGFDWRYYQRKVNEKEPLERKARRKRKRVRSCKRSMKKRRKNSETIEAMEKKILLLEQELQETGDEASETIDAMESKIISLQQELQETSTEVTKLETQLHNLNSSSL